MIACYNTLNELEIVTSHVACQLLTRVLHSSLLLAPSEAEAPKNIAPVGAASSGITAPLTSTSTTANNTNNAGSGSHEIQEAKTSGVPVGGAIAGTGIAAAAAGTAAAAGLGHDKSDGGKEEILEAKTSGESE